MLPSKWQLAVILFYSNCGFNRDVYVNMDVLTAREYSLETEHWTKPPLKARSRQLLSILIPTFLYDTLIELVITSLTPSLPRPLGGEPVKLSFLRGDLMWYGYLIKQFFPSQIRRPQRWNFIKLSPFSVRRAGYGH